MILRASEDREASDMQRLIMNLFDAIFSSNHLDRTAILYEQQRISYAELRDQTLAVARMLRRLGVVRGDRLALLLSDSPEFIACFIAITTQSAIAVPVNLALRPVEQRAILNDCSATVAIAEANICKLLCANSKEELPHLKQMIVVSREDDQPELSNASTSGSEQAGSENNELQRWSFTELLSEADVGPGVPAHASVFAASENEPAFIFYTSGSTGEPKGAMHRLQDIFYTNETYCREVLRLRDGDRMFSSSRLPFAYGFGNAFSFPLLNGCATILCRERPNPEVIAKVFADYKPTIFFAVPVVFRLLLDAQEKHNTTLDCASLRLCISAGEALPAALGEAWEKAQGVPVLDGIGSTEMLHMWMSNHEGEVRYGSSGKLLKGYEARLLDSEGRPTPAEREGNLWVQGASAAIGYWQQPETTARTFVDGWVRTGDLYRQDSQGFWYHMGRSDDCFKSSGQWVSPVEVEGVLLRHEAVGRVAVVEDFDETGLPCACAFVVRSTKIAAKATLEVELREFARASLPRFKQPRRYEFVDELPYTATGKLQRFKLRKMIQGPKYNVQSLSSAKDD